MVSLSAWVTALSSKIPNGLTTLFSISTTASIAPSLSAEAFERDQNFCSDSTHRCRSLWNIVVHSRQRWGY